MALDKSPLLTALDHEIAVKERELEEAKRAANKIADLTNDVVSLKRTRQILIGDNSQSMQALITEVNAPVNASPPSGQNGTDAAYAIEKNKPMPLSIGAAVIKTLKEAGKPVKAMDLLLAARLLTEKPSLTYHTLSAVLSVYTGNKKIRRTGTGIYALPKEASATNAA
jgi:hypothetical protein